MRNSLLSIALLVMATSLSFAADKPVVPADKTGMGVVKSVSVADAAKGTKSEIVVANEAGTTTNFLVKATTTLYDVDSKATTLDKVVAGNKIAVLYTVTGEGVNEAKSVKLLK